MSDTEKMPADWSIQKSLERGLGNLYDTESVKDAPLAFAATLALARMIEKYEPHLAPVDPDVLAVREVLAGYWGNRGSPKTEAQYRHGQRDDYPEFLASLAAYRKVKS